MLREQKICATFTILSKLCEILKFFFLYNLTDISVFSKIENSVARVHLFSIKVDKNFAILIDFIPKIGFLSMKIIIDLNGTKILHFSTLDDIYFK